jgi:hypothetical protein
MIGNPGPPGSSLPSRTGKVRSRSHGSRRQDHASGFTRASEAGRCRCAEDVEYRRWRGVTKTRALTPLTWLTCGRGNPTSGPNGTPRCRAKCRRRPIAARRLMEMWEDGVREDGKTALAIDREEGVRQARSPRSSRLRTKLFL